MEDYLVVRVRRPSKFVRLARLGVNSMLARAGLQLSRTNALLTDSTEAYDDPVEAGYRAGLSPYLLDIALEHCRVLPSTAYACASHRGNPFVDTLIGYARGEIKNFEQSPLAGFYRTWQPLSAADVLGLTGDDVAPELLQAPPLGFVMPWNDWSPARAEQRWAGIIEADNREHGGLGKAKLGWKSWGPVDPTIGQQEFGRLISVFDSIKTRGYQRSEAGDGDIKGVALHRAGEFRVLVTAGHHRASALAALGRTTVPIRIDNMLVRREDAAAWPNVRTGLFTKQQALALFDRLFEGRQPASCRWPTERLTGPS